MTSIARAGGSGRTLAVPPLPPPPPTPIERGTFKARVLFVKQFNGLPAAVETAMQAWFTAATEEVVVAINVVGIGSNVCALIHYTKG